MSRVKFSDDANLRELDPDEATNMMLFRQKSTFSKARLQRMKIMSVITGNYVSRKKIFCQIQEHTDYNIYEIAVLGKTLKCAKVFNPSLLARNSNIWTRLADVQRFELEDPEGILTTIPKHYATNMINLEAFSITWTRVKSLPIELFREKLKTLNLQRNQLKTLDGIEKAVNLSALDVSSNLMTELPRTLGQLQSLTTLNISGNAIRELPENFGALNQLRVLDCSCNRLENLPESIGNLLELKILDVCNNHLVTFPASIGNMPKLDDLRARGNLLKSLPRSFERLKWLSSLILRKNKFEEVPPQLSGISSLQSLNMRENFIRRFGRAIPSLKTLVLDSNQMEEIDDGILSCQNLQMLSLESNDIRLIPDEIVKLKYLRVLHLSKNNIDRVPEVIEQLDHLRHLNLRSTKIRTLPLAISRMDHLAQLDIDNCTELEDRYLMIELRDRGIAGLKDYLIQSRDPSNTVPRDTSPAEVPLQNTARATMMPDYAAPAAPVDRPQLSSADTLQSLNRGTLFSPPVGENHQYAAVQKLASKPTKPEHHNELIQLGTIKEDRADDDRDTATGIGTQDVQYGCVVKKPKEGGAGQQQGTRSSDDEESLDVVDSEVLLRQNPSPPPFPTADKRQSKV